jgi:hypothetical protein
MAKDPDWLKALKQEAKRLGKTVHELLVEKNIKKDSQKAGPMKASMGGMAKKKDAVKRANDVIPPKTRGLFGAIAGNMIKEGKVPPKIGATKAPPKQGVMPDRKPVKDRLGDLIRMRKGFK